MSTRLRYFLVSNMLFAGIGICCMLPRFLNNPKALFRTVLTWDQRLPGIKSLSTYLLFKDTVPHHLHALVCCRGEVMTEEWSVGWFCGCSCLYLVSSSHDSCVNFFVDWSPANHRFSFVCIATASSASSLSPHLDPIGGRCFGSQHL